MAPISETGVKKTCEICAKRVADLYSEDERRVLRQSHNDPQSQKLYDEYLTKPDPHKAHELLHTIGPVLTINVWGRGQTSPRSIPDLERRQ